MSKQASEFQEKTMSHIYRGKEIFKPLNTGRIDKRVSCVQVFVANIFFYTKNGVTIMIDAGCNYDRLAEKMGWLNLDPAAIRHILITHVGYGPCGRGGDGQPWPVSECEALHRRGGEPLSHRRGAAQGDLWALQAAYYSRRLWMKTLAVPEHFILLPFFMMPIFSAAMADIGLLIR